MQIDPLICVLMPVYNGSLTIKSSIQSLIMQTYQNWVCIIVNDGSTDNTREVLSEISDKRFNVIHLDKNMGRGFARQTCLDNSTGDYIAFLDADDFYHPDKLQEQLYVFKNNQSLGLVGCGLVSFDNKFNVRTKRGVKYSGKTIKYFKYDDLLFHPVTVMIKREKANQIRYNTALNAAEDIDYLSKYLEGEFYFILPHVYYYYNEDESTSVNKIVTYYFYALLKEVSLLRNYKFILFYNAFIAFCKLLIISIVSPVAGTKYFIRKRGIVTSNDEKNEYYRIHNLITCRCL